MTAVATQLHTRRFAAQDSGFVEALAAEAFAEFSETAARTALFVAEHHVSLIAVVGEARVGFASVALKSDDDMPCLVAIAVSRPWRGRGVGTTLLRAAEEAAKAAGASHLKAHTADANLAALDLLLKHGYRICKRHRRYYRRIWNACELIKRL